MLRYPLRFRYIESDRPNDQYRPQRILPDLRPQDFHVQWHIGGGLIFGPLLQIVDDV